jgi:hypothetical protein
MFGAYKKKIEDSRALEKTVSLLYGRLENSDQRELFQCWRKGGDLEDRNVTKKYSPRDVENVKQVVIEMIKAEEVCL